MTRPVENSGTPLRAKSEKPCGIASPNRVWPPDSLNAKSAEDGHCSEGRNERQDADIGDERSVDDAAREPAQERSADRHRRRSARDEDERGHNAGQAGHRADAEIEVPHRHHHRHRSRDHGEHAHLLRDIEKIAPSEEGRRQLQPEVADDQRDGDEGSISSEQRGHACVHVRYCRTQFGGEGPSPRT